MLRQREVAKSFAVDQALALGDLQADRAEHGAVRALGDLEFRNTPGQVPGRVLQRIPHGRQLADVVQRRAPHTILHRAHAAEFRIEPYKFKAQKPMLSP